MNPYDADSLADVSTRGPSHLLSSTLRTVRRIRQRGVHVMSTDQDDLEPFDPAENVADTAAEFEDDDRDDDRVEAGAPALSPPSGGGVDG
jgi:hypothetical protein